AAVVKRLEIGSAVISNSPAVVIAASLMRLRTSDGRIPSGGLQVDGIIGWDTIRQFDVSLDYRRGTITLRRPEILETSGTTTQNLIWLGKPFVEVRTKPGAILHFTLDTGAQSSFVNDATLKKANLTTRISQAQVFGIARTGALTGRVVPSLRLDIAGKWVELRSAVVYGSTSPGFVNCDGILGSDIAQFGTVRIDATNGLFSIGSEDAAE
ncbi:MAG TPA: hypothetical protein VK494_02375, partial [Gemmatimonadaceae bacterium]|nr:hypothetical protein [Gemmatimonadaceae bacterium]